MRHRRGRSGNIPDSQSMNATTNTGESTMSRHVTMGNSVKFMSIFLLFGAAGAPALVQASADRVVCSTSGVEGPYVFSVVPAFRSFQGPQGSISAFAPVALLGRYVFNGQGSVSRSLSVS